MSERIQRYEALMQEYTEAVKQYDADYLGRMDIPVAELKARWQRPRDEMDAMLKDRSFVREMRAHVLARQGR